MTTSGTTSIPNVMLNVGNYLNNSEDIEVAANLYDTYIGAELNFQDAGGNAVYIHVKRSVQNNDSQAVIIVHKK